MDKIISFLKDVWAERKNIRWPTRHEALYLTIAVIVISLAVAYFSGFLDFLFSLVLKWSFLKF